MRLRSAHRRAETAIVLAILVAGLPGFSAASRAASPGNGELPGAATSAATRHADDAVLVGFTPKATEDDKRAARRAAGAESSKKLSKDPKGAEKLRLRQGRSVEQAIAALKANPRVRYAEPDYVVEHTATSNDPYYLDGSLWGMYGDASPLQVNAFGSGAAEAWQLGFAGSRSIVVGIIDEGIQVAHPDLAANIWTNPGEIAGNGLDDDANGYVDDVNGWDFFNDDASVFDGNQTEGQDAHGTHVAGTIGGVGGNGIGVAGVNWQVTLISAKFLGPNGGSISDAVSALAYLTDLKINHGINIVASSNSWGGGGFSQAMLDAIEAAGDAGMLFVAAAGNSNTNNDLSASYPSNYQCTRGGTRGWDCVVAVAAITSSGARASFSSYGATTVDLGAPGVGVWSSVPLGSYASYSGTSMATPHVSGAVALCASINPGLTAQAVRQAVVGTVAPTASMAGTTASGGRLDVGAMVGQCSPSTAPVDGAPSALTATALSPTRIGLSWVDGSSNETAFAIQRSPVSGGLCTAFTAFASVGQNQTSFTAGGL
ncbi:MAG: peptidase S8 [Chloroflexi bacterium]|nr:peptidase S8 [Chloroflexota bacterium]